MERLINVVTLGCSKNVVDSEHIMAQLEAAGYRLTVDSNRTQAKIVIINTCGFIADAKQESIDTILRFAYARQRGLVERLFVIGCLSQRYREELREEIPEVDEYFGARDINEVVRALSVTPREDLATVRKLTTPSHYAYLKISEGCNWHCSYCAIPLIRGRHVSFPMEQIVEEAERLAARGVRELMVIGQDTTYYGIDLYGRRRLAELLHRLCRIEGIEWIRLHYAYPTAFPDDVIEAMATEEKICKYLDIPLQHIADSQLAAMQRNITAAQTEELIDQLRRRIPPIALRTTLIVGFPNESEEDFACLCDFVERTRFERLGVFAYCQEEGTPSAATLTDNVPPQVKQQRVDKIMELQSNISAQLNASMVGSVQRVIIDRREGEYYVGRTERDSVEVDNEVLICSPKRLRRGTFHNVLVTRAEEYDLYGELAD